MNFFYLDDCPRRAAENMCDQHVVKMILETAQLLSTAHVELDGDQVAYKATHKNHPSAVTAYNKYYEFKFFDWLQKGRPMRWTKSA